MKTAIMQPYLFPYIGYFQLINAVDQFVVYDDVNYIKNGWINRNQYLLYGKAKYFTLSLNKASSFVPINQTHVLDDEHHRTKEKILKKFKMAYSRAPFYKTVYGLVEDIAQNPDNNIATYNENALRKICTYLNVDTEIYISSKLNKDNALAGQDKVISICKCLQSSIYVNAIGGRSLYSHSEFERNSIKLKFLKTHFDRIYYEQFGDPFVSGLSIIDVLMFNSCEDIRKFLKECSLED